MNVIIGICFVSAVILVFGIGEIWEGIIAGVVGAVLLYLKKESKPGDPIGTAIVEARRKYDNDRFVKMVINSFRSNGWKDCYRSNYGVSVYNDRIVTKFRTFKFDNHGFSKLSNRDCYLLARYIGDALPQGYEYSVSAIKDCSSVRESPYFLYETPGGHLDIGGGGDYRESVVGYHMHIPKR